MDNSGIGRMLLTDLLKAFDCLWRDLLIAEPAAYCFDQPSVCFIYSYLSDRIHRTQVSNAYCSYTNVTYGIPQASIPGALLSNIDFCNLFWWGYKCNIASHANENTLYTSDISLNLVLEKVESSTHDLFRWYKETHIKANLDKCHILVTTP